MIASGIRVLRLEADAIREVAERIDGSFCRAVELLRHCAGRVVVTGIGKSGLIGRKLAATLSSTGTPALFLHPAEGVHGDLGMLVRGDVAVALSNSGESAEILALVPAIKRLAVSLVVVTGNPQSGLAEFGDVVLNVSVRQEACPLDLTPTASTTATLALCDALAIAILDQRGFRSEDLALLHPGGVIGRRFVQVRDLMRTGDAVPLVREDSSTGDVLREMSAKKLGAAAVVDAVGLLVGIVTDGDLRRALQRSPMLPATARELMTSSPKTIGADDLATAALAAMESHAVTQLVIIDSAGRPEGIIHLHDLLRGKIA